MKVMISYQVDTVEEAKAVLDAVGTLGEMTTLRVQDTETRVLETVEATKPRQNVSPGASTISRISTRARNELLDAVGKGVELTPKQKEVFGEHLKLLWSRGEVKFDGTVYYL